MTVLTIVQHKQRKQPKPFNITYFPDCVYDLADLKADMCRFCVGDGPFKFCGKPVSRGCYCTECAKVVYNK